MAAMIDWRILVLGLIVLVVFLGYKDRKESREKKDLTKVANDVVPLEQKEK